jgi:protein AIR1/2
VTRDDAQENSDLSLLEGDPDPSSRLLLPAHVSVLNTGANSGKIPIKIITPPEFVEDYIEYLDYDDFKVGYLLYLPQRCHAYTQPLPFRQAAGVVRYFDEESQEPQKPKIVCKNCGAAGEHKTADCPIQIVMHTALVVWAHV